MWTRNEIRMLRLYSWQRGPSTFMSSKIWQRESTEFDIIVLFFHMKYWWIVISNTVDRRCWERCHKIRDPDYQSIGIHVKTHFESAFLSLILENLYFGYVLGQSISPLNEESNWYHLISYCQIFLVRTHVILKKRHYGIDAGNEKLSESGSQMLKTGETQKIPQVWKKMEVFPHVQNFAYREYFWKTSKKTIPFSKSWSFGLV